MDLYDYLHRLREIWDLYPRATISLLLAAFGFWSALLLVWEMSGLYRKAKHNEVSGCGKTERNEGVLKPKR